MGELPFHALLSQALMAFTIDYEESPQYPMALTALASAIPDEPVVLADLPSSLGEHALGLLERHRLVEVSGRDKHHLVTPTAHGARIRELHDPALDTAAEAWPDRYGDQLVRGLYDDLESLDRDRVGDPPITCSSPSRAPSASGTSLS